MSDNDNFDALWERLKQSVRERREPDTVGTMGNNPFDVQAGRIYTDSPSDNGHDQDACTIWLRVRNATVSCEATREDLINIAEHMLLRAAQFPQP
jgi:hypothetical protein